MTDTVRMQGLPEFVQSRRGRPKLLHLGYSYCLDKSSGDAMYWRCEHRTCRGRITTRSGQIETEAKEHSHDPDDALNLALKTLSRLKKRPRQSDEQASDEMKPCTTDLSSEVPAKKVMLQALVWRERSVPAKKIRLRPSARRERSVPAENALSDESASKILRQDEPSQIDFKMANTSELKGSPEIIQSQRGKPKLLHLGYAYCLDKSCGEAIYWRCEHRSCRGRITTRNGEIESEIKEHSHDPDHARNLALKTVIKIKERAKQSNEMASIVVETCTNDLPSAALEALPKKTSLSHLVRRQRSVPSVDVLNDELLMRNARHSHPLQGLAGKKKTSEMVDSPELIQSQRGKPKLLHSGFAYCLDKSFGDTMYWRCEHRFCRGRITTRNGELENEIKEHAHDPDYARNLALKTVVKIKERAKLSDELASNVVETCTNDLPSAALEALPKKTSLSQLVRRQRSVPADDYDELLTATLRKFYSSQKNLVKTRISEEKEPHEIVQSRKGKPKLLHLGYAYCLDKSNGDTMYWRCEHRICRGRITTRNGQIDNEIKEHSHDSDYARNLALKTVVRIKERAKKSDELASDVVETCTNDLPIAALEALPKKTSLSRLVRRQRSVLSCDNFSNERLAAVSN